MCLDIVFGALSLQHRIGHLRYDTPVETRARVRRVGRPFAPELACRRPQRKKGARVRGAGLSVRGSSLSAQRPTLETEREKPPMCSFEREVEM